MISSNAALQTVSVGDFALSATSYTSGNSVVQTRFSGMLSHSCKMFRFLIDTLKRCMSFHAYPSSDIGILLGDLEQLSAANASYNHFTDTCIETTYSYC